MLHEKSRGRRERAVPKQHHIPVLNALRCIRREMGRRPLHRNVILDHHLENRILHMSQMLMTWPNQMSPFMRSYFIPLSAKKTREFPILNEGSEVSIDLPC